MSKVLDYEALQERGIRYSRPHLWRLWKDNKFPKPFKLGAGRNVWLESEIDSWLKQRVDQRDGAAA